MSGNAGYGRSTSRMAPTSSGDMTAMNGLWEGVVADDKDPEQLGRVRVRIFDLHDESVPIDKLPWAEPNLSAAFVNHTDQDRNGGFFHIPPVDSLLNLMFRRGDPERPVWMGGWWGKSPCVRGRETYDGHEKRDNLYNEAGIPSCPTWATLRGHRIELDDEMSELRITSPKGHKITLSDSGANEHNDSIKLEDHKGNFIWMRTDNDRLEIFWNGDCHETITGNYHRKVDGDEVRYIGGDLTENTTGLVNVKSGGDRNVDAATIYQQCGKASPLPIFKPNPGTTSGGDPINKVLEVLGNAIKKVLTGD